MAYSNKIIDFILTSSIEMIYDQIDEIHPADFLEAFAEYDGDPIQIL